MNERRSKQKQERMTPTLIIFIIIFYQQINTWLVCLSSLVDRRLLASSWHSPRALIVVTNTKAYTVNAERRAYVYRSNCRVAATGSFRDVIDRKRSTLNANIISNTPYVRHRLLHTGYNRYILAMFCLCVHLTDKSISSK